MFEQRKELIAQFYREGVYQGYITTFIDHEHYDTMIKGYAAIVPTKERLTMEHYFDIASLTKVVGTVSIYLKLIEQKQLTLDQSICTILPNFKDPSVTIRQLLTHTSGIDTWIKNRDQLTKPELQAAYLEQKAGPLQEKKLNYTDTGYILLGMALESYYDLPLADIFQQELFTPLEMEKIQFGPITKHLAVATEKRGGSVLKGQIHDPKARILGQAGHAGLFATHDTLLKFINEFLANEPKLYKKHTLDDLLHDQTKVHLKRSLGWELKTIDERSVLFHTGYTGTFILIDPLKQRAWLFLSNRVHPDDHRQAYLKKRDQLVQTYLKESEKEDQKQM